MISVEPGTTAPRLPTVLVENLLQDADAVVTGGGDFDLALTGGTYDFWTPDDAVAYVDFSFASPLSFDCLCIAAHDLASYEATVTVTVDGGVVATHTPSDNSAIMMLFGAVQSSSVRVRISSGTGGVSIAAIMLGKSLTMQRGVSSGYVPTNWAERSTIFGGTTVSGQFLPQRQIRTGGETAIDFVPINSTWWAANAEPLRVQYNSGQPFFYAGGPSIFPNDIAYCWRAPSSRELLPKLSLGDFVSVGFTVNFYA